MASQKPRQRVSRRNLLRHFGFGLAGATPEDAPRRERRRPPAPRPNIVLVLVDDMGYSDIGCFGGPVQTPHLDRLGQGGVRYTQFYNAARCCPARAALMTGLYPHQAGMGWMTAADLGTDGYAGDLNNQCRTIAECLRPAGYSTYMSGKWHLTSEKYMKADAPNHSWPLQRGFDRFFGTLTGAGNYYRPHTLRDGNEEIEAWEGFYYTDAISDQACRFIADHVQSPGTASRPFFLYTAYTAPHWPLHARPDEIDVYRGRFAKGWDVLRGEKFEHMRGLGILDERWGLSERDADVKPWENLDAVGRDDYDLRMSIYAAQIAAVDRGIGRIIEALARLNQLDDTLILFLSDNGGCHEEVHNKESDPSKIGGAESFESYGRPWANYSNAPFREFKSWTHEGGISTPLIAHWPGGIQNPGRLDPQLGHLTDILPTCLEVAGAEYPPPGGDGLHDLVGESFAPSLRGEPFERSTIFWEHEANRALRRGNWKLVGKGLGGPWELYDMVMDRSERRNLAKDKPALVDDMAAEWQRIAHATYVYPLDERPWGPRIEDPLRRKT